MRPAEPSALLGQIRTAALIASLCCVASAVPLFSRVAHGTDAEAPVTTPLPPAAVKGFDPIAFQDLPGWAGDDHAAALATFVASCHGIAGDPSRFGGGNFGQAEDWAVACRAAFKTKPADARSYFETYFEADHVAGEKGASKITGYYEPVLKGSHTQSAEFPTPIYGPPDDLVTVDPEAFASILHGERLAGRVVNGMLEPYDTRAQIEGGTLENRVKTLLYVTSTVESFFLQIQGSGRVKLAEGGQVRLGYKAQNGYPYVSIGALLVERKEIRREDLSMQTIRAWLAEHPDQAIDLMNENPSYVFFVETPLDDPSEGPPGAENVPLTPNRSMAVDDRVYPYGVPIFVTGEIATADGTGKEPIARLMVAQDTGGAIRGTVRGDIFFGWGDEAAARAGATGGPAEFYVLRPRTMPPSLPK